MNNHKIELDEIIDTILNLNQQVFLTNEEYIESFHYLNIII